MITRENLPDVIKQIDKRDMIRVMNSNREFCALNLHVFNVGTYTTVRLSDSPNKRYTSECVLETHEVQQMIAGIKR